MSDAPTPVATMFDAIMQGSVIQVSLDDNVQLTPVDRQQLTNLLTAADKLARLHAPGQPPPLCIGSATWAAQTLHFFTRVLMNRIETDVALPDNLSKCEPLGSSATQHWSVDLVFRVLPDLERRCACADSLDPLRKTILSVASRWPLSALGIDTSMDETAKTVALSDNSLRAIWMDRMTLVPKKSLTEESSTDETLK